MEDKLAKILKLFKSIKPDDGFVLRSRSLISASEQRAGFSIWENVKIAAALALASILLFVALGGLSSINGNSGPALLADDDSQIQIQLGEAQYYLGDPAKVGADVEEILKNLAL